MKIRLEDAGIEKKSIMRNLLELYMYDFSEFDNVDINECGLYGYKYLDHYWEEKGRFPLIIRVDDKIAGFALIRSMKEEKMTIFYMSEFFILKKYRKKGIGKNVAFGLFDKFKGIWIIGQTKENIPAQKFWKKIITEYTNGRFEEVVSETWEGPLQKFTSKSI